MSFLTRRNLPLAFQGWKDLDAGHSQPDSNPIRQPWGQWGGGQAVQRVGDVMVMPGTTLISSVGGYAHEFQPFTSTWGVDFDYSGTISGITAQAFMCFINSGWNLRNISGFTGGTTSLVFEIFHTGSSGGGGTNIRLSQFNNDTTETVYFSAPAPGGDGFWSSTFHTIRCWFDNDTNFRCYVDGQLLLYCTIPATWRTSPGNRAFNFYNRIVNNGYLKNFYVYDRPKDFGAFTSVAFDDFNRSNGAVANGWTTVGTAGQIQSNSYAMTGTTDGSNAIIRNTGVTSGVRRVEATIGGNNAPNGTADCGLMLCDNGSGTAGLSANIYDNKVYISRYSSSLNANQPTWNDLASNTSLSSNIASGDVIGFNINSPTGLAWIDRNGEILCWATNVHAVIPATNSWAGARVNRKLFNMSGSWNDWRMSSAA